MGTEKCRYCTGLIRRSAKYSLGRNEITPWDDENQIIYVNSCRKHLQRAIGDIGDKLELIIHETGIWGDFENVHLLRKKGDTQVLGNSVLISQDEYVQIYRSGQKVGFVDSNRVPHFGLESQIGK